MLITQILKLFKIVGSRVLLRNSSLGLDGNSKTITNVADPSDSQDASTKNYVDTAISLIPDPLVPKDAIALPADFPTLALVEVGWTYWIIADVTDNDVTKTNTGQSFLIDDEIFWSGTAWVNLGSRTFWKRTGTTIEPHVANDSLNLGSGALTTTGTLSSGGIITQGDSKVYSNSTDALTKSIAVYKSRGTYATPTVITTGDCLGEIVGHGHDGTNYIRSGSIRFKSSGTIGTNRVPSSIEFRTSTNANPSVETLYATIKSTGVFSVPKGLEVYDISVTPNDIVTVNATNVSVSRNGLTTTSSDGQVIANISVSTAGVPSQISPRARFTGTALNSVSGLSETNSFIIENLPVTAAGTTSATLKFGVSINGGAYTYPMTLSNIGTLTLLGNCLVANGGYLSNGSAPARGLYAVGTLSTGNIIERNINDAYTIQTINNANASSTGNILDLQWQSVNRITFSKNGSINLNTTDALGAGTININAVRYFHAFSPANALDSNLFIGSGSGNFTMGGTGDQGGYNVGIGKGTLQANTIGNYNTANGMYSLYLNTTGSSNTANGFSSLRSNTTGNNNTANGYFSLYSNTTGSNNTANGYNAGRSITTGGNNSFFGVDAGYHASQKVDATNSMALGYGAYTTASNQIVLGNGSITQILCGQSSQAEVVVGKLETTVAGEGIIVKSPDGTRYKITVANGGTITVAAA